MKFLVRYTHTESVDPIEADTFVPERDRFYFRMGNDEEVARVRSEYVASIRRGGNTSSVASF